MMLTKTYFYSGKKFDLIMVRAGTTDGWTDGTVTTISNVLVHPKYRKAPRTADIAVTVLDKSLSLSPRVLVLALPMPGLYIPDGSLMTVAGWGFQSVSMNTNIYYLLK